MGIDNSDLTYRDLIDILLALTEEEKDQNVCVYDQDNEKHSYVWDVARDSEHGTFEGQIELLVS